MKKMLGLFILLGANLPGFGQLGISGSYTWFKADAWEVFVNQNVNEYKDEYFFQHGYQLGLDYWFRLEKTRVEFFPELRYSQFRSSPVSTEDEGTLNWQSFSFHWTTNIYPFDMQGDCDCPTFSKQDPIFKKGLFLQVSPGINLLRESYRSDKSLILLADVKDLAFTLGLGAGLDLGISDWITLSPYGRITLLLDGEWPGFGELPVFPKLGNPGADIARPYELLIPEAGMRLGIRWKH